LVFRRGVPPDATYTFKHALVQDAAYESLLKSRRRKIHADIAAALRSRSFLLEDNEPELLAHHYSQAGLAEIAIGYCEKAWDRALGRSANVEAFGHYRAAVALLEKLPPSARSEKELTLQIGIGSALTSAEGYGTPATGAAYRRAREICLELGDRKHLVPVMYGLANYYLTAGQYEEARQTADELVKFAEEQEEPGPFLAAHSCLGAVQTFMGSWSDASDSLEKCIGLYDLRRDALLKFEYAEDPCVVAYVFNSICAWNLGYPDQALKSINAAALLAEQLRHANSTAHVSALETLLHNLLGDPRATLTAAEVGLAIANEKGLPYWVAIISVFEGWALSQLGKVDEPIARISAAIGAFRGTGARAATTIMQAVLAEAYRAASHYDDALKSVEEGLQFAREWGEGLSEAELLRLKGLVLRDRSPADHERVESSLIDALGVARQQKAKSMEPRISIDLARLWREQGKISKAVGLLGPVYESFTEGIRDKGPQGGQGTAHQSKCLAQLRSGVLYRHRRPCPLVPHVRSGALRQHVRNSTRQPSLTLSRQSRPVQFLDCSRLNACK
jgi:predicted ATPase